MDTRHLVKKTLAKTTGVTAFVILLSKVLTYLTAIVIGARFGASRITDAYLISLVIPEFLILLFGMSFGFVLTTLLTEYITKGNEEKGWELASIVSTLLVVVFSLSAVILFFLSPVLSNLLAPGFDIEAKILVTKLSRIALWYMVFSGLTYVTRSILHSYRRFIVAAISPGLLQIITVIFILLWPGDPRVLSINTGMFIGALFCFAFQAFSLRGKASEFNFRLRWDPKHPGLKRAVSLAYPLSLYSIAFQVNIGVDRIVASTLKAGSIAALDFAYKVNSIFLPVFAVALFTVALPIFSEQVVLKDWQGFKEILSLGMRLLNFIFMPISLFMIFMSAPLIRLFFERGAFDAYATGLTSEALVMYALGLAPYALCIIVSCGLIALGDGRAIAKLSAIIILLNLILDLILSRYLGHKGIALATSIVCIFGLWSYAKALQRRVNIISFRDMAESVIKTFLASLIMVLLALPLYKLLGAFIDTATFRGQLLQMGIVIFMASILYLGFSFLLQVKEMKELYLLLRKK